MDEVRFDAQSTADERAFSQAGPIRLLPAVDSMGRSRYFAALRNENAVTLLPVTPISSLASQIRSLKPDVVAISSKNLSTAEWRDDESLRQALSTVPAILLTDVESRTTKKLAAELYIASVLPQDLSPRQLLIAIQAVAAGFVVALPPFPKSGEEHIGVDHPGLGEEPPVEHLTPREVAVLRLMALGHGNKEIALRLNISEHTAKFHVSSILGKLGANSRTEAVTIGILRGFVAI